MIGSMGYGEAAMDNAAFYVATNGNDHWSDKLSAPNTHATDGPFATLKGARQAIRTLRHIRTQGGAPELPDGGVTMWLRGGTYPLYNTFELTTEDSGTPEAPIVYRAYRDEEVRLIGGAKIPGGCLSRSAMQLFWTDWTRLPAAKCCRRT